MPVLFWDTSALVKKYFAEVGSETVQVLLGAPGHFHNIAPLTLAEVSSAIVRRANPDQATELLAAFDEDVRPGGLVNVLEFPDDIFGRAVELVRRHRLRGCDALQLVAAVAWAVAFRELEDVGEQDYLFVCADDALNVAARAEGLAVINPAKT